MYDIVNNLLHATRQAMHIVYITFATFSKHYLVKMEDANVFQERDDCLYKSMRCLLNNLPHVLQ